METEKFALIGCECSGVVSDAFAEHGVTALSCDLKPCERGGRHIQADVIDAINSREQWDFIGLHPECTALAVSGNRHYAEGKPLHHKRIAAVKWTVDLWNLAKSKSRFAYLENPVGVLPKMGGMTGKRQVVQPWQFGHGEVKATCLWLHNLPELKPTNIVEGREPRVWKMPPSDQRATERSRTYQGIGDAMAAQWSPLL
jgi:hypothetical protein